MKHERTIFCQDRWVALCHVPGRVGGVVEIKVVLKRYC